jgi:hypothetical protein
MRKNVKLRVFPTAGDAPMQQPAADIAKGGALG